MDTPLVVTALARLLVCLGCLAWLSAQASSQPRATGFIERFDSTAPPALPPGWASSSIRSADGDFTLTAVGARSLPGCVISTNATIAQWLASPLIDLSGWRECTLRWMERRSATHDGNLIIEASTDAGVGYERISGDTLPPQGGTSYLERSLTLPEHFWEQRTVSIRWRLIGDGTGTTGTLRLDDISVTGRPRYDLSISAGVPDPLRPLAGELITFGGHVINMGIVEAGESTVWWAIDLNRNGTMDESEIQGSFNPGSIPPDDSVSYLVSVIRPGADPLTLFAIISDDSDMVAGNDTAQFHLPSAVAPSSVLINEIMYDPLPGRAEYVELYNRTLETLDLTGWHLTDREGDSTSGVLAGGHFLLAPGEFLLCSPDTTMARDYADIPAGVRRIEGARGFTLNNMGDRVILTDASGGTIDRVEYSPQWHTPALDDTRGRSLERIASETAGSGAWNWGTAAGPSGGTPGYRNSLATAGVTPDDRLSCSPNPFSPDGDGFEDVTGIGYRLGEGAVIARVRIYDVEGRPIRTITGSEYVGGTGSFAWNGYDDRGRKVPIGIYLILLDAIDASGTAAISARGVVVVAGRL